MHDETTVVVEGIALRGRCGVTDEERAVGQTLVVDVRLVPRATGAASSDDLADTVDYARVVELVREVVEGTEFRLLERLAGELVERLWAGFSLERLELSVAKAAPPVAVPVGAARVEVVRRA